MASEVNSRSYWNTRFSTDWAQLGGGVQSEFFARTAIQALPEWLQSDIRNGNLSILDFGCAEGQGTAVLKQAFPSCDVRGCDFSEAAIAIASSRFPQLDFFVSDQAQQQANRSQVVFCSNVAEHFFNPQEFIETIGRSADDHLVLMVPMWEIARGDEHLYSFFVDSFPVVLGQEKVLSFLSVINTASHPAGFWNGWQAVAVYSAPDALDRSGLTLADLLRSLLIQSVELDGMTEPLKLDRTFSEIATVIDNAASRGVRASVLSDQVAALSAGLQDLASAVRQGQQGVLEVVDRHGEEQRNRHETVFERMADAGNASMRVLAEALEEVRREVQSSQLAQARNVEKMLTVTRHHRRELHGLRNEVAAAMEQRNWLAMRLDRVEAERKAAIAKVQEIEGSTSWRITAPLRRLVTSLRAFGKTTGKEKAGGTGFSHPAAPVGISIELEEILARNQGKPIIVFPPVVDWDLPLFQRPHHIALRLARHGFLYFYCTPRMYDKVDGYLRIEDGIYLTNRFEEVSGLYREKFVHLYSTDNFTTVGYVRNQQQNLGTVIYEYIDEIDETISGKQIPEHVWEKHRYLISDPDVLCIASADKLVEDIRAVRGSDPLLVTNGVDVEHFRDVHGGDLPASLVGFKGPSDKVVGYFGALASWFDYELIRRISKERPDVKLLLLGWDYDGSLATSGIGDLENVKIMGPIPYVDLPAYAAVFDVSIIPFKLNAVTESTSPIKLFEYMALGTPIVTTDLPECRKYSSVLIGATHDAFMERLAEAFEKRADAEYLALLEREAAENDWDAKAGLIAARLHASLEDRMDSTIQVPQS